jgi:hypothetical protein
MRRLYLLYVVPSDKSLGLGTNQAGLAVGLTNAKALDDAAVDPLAVAVEEPQLVCAHRYVPFWLVI